MNLSASDILKVLRLFQQADDGHTPRQVERISKQQLTDSTVCISFHFLKRAYALYIDNAAADDSTYISEVVTHHLSDDRYQLLENPVETNAITYGVPFKGKDVYLLHQVTDEVRLDSALVQRIGGYSRSSFQKLIQNGLIMVNGRVETIPKRKVSLHDVLEIAKSPARLKARPPIETIYEDQDVLVVNKPAGLLTHAKGELTEEATAADYVADITAYQPTTNRPGIVHRLDRATSGVLLLVKTKQAAQLISRQFSDRKVKKSYYAVVSGTPQQPQALIDLPIGRHPTAPSTFRVDPNGKPAQTTYTVERTTGHHSMLLLQPRTGRTHQLRVHMHYLGCPIVGDTIYGGEAADRMYLHAASLEVTLPGGVRKVFHAPLPAGFDKLVQESV